MIQRVVLICLLALAGALTPLVAFGQAAGGSPAPGSKLEYFTRNSNDRFTEFTNVALQTEGPPKRIELVVADIVRVILGFIGILLILLILYGGFMWMTSAGNEDRIDKAKKIITNATIGVTIIFVSYAIAAAITGWLARAAS